MCPYMNYFTQFLTMLQPVPSVLDSVGGLSSLLSPKIEILASPSTLPSPSHQAINKFCFSNQTNSIQIWKLAPSYLHRHCPIRTWALPVGDTPAASCLTLLSSGRHQSI